MDSVGLRDLKNRLSEYVERVKSGEALVVTDCGQAVAELRPIRGTKVRGAGTVEKCKQSGVHGIPVTRVAQY